MQGKVKIGTRGSKLALWQAHFTRDRLQDAGYEVEIQIIKTKGDKIQHLSFDKIEGKGFFTKELEDALLSKEVDLAVHSCKDLPTNSPLGLTIAAYSKRAAANDVLLIHPDAIDDTMMFGFKNEAVVGTSSARRKTQLLSFRPDAQIKDIRGNVPTRIQKLREGQFDAILLAAAGIDRLELDVSDLKRVDLPVTQYIPAPAQGVLAFQIRSEDDRMKKIVSILNDKTSVESVAIERKLLNAFDGGCQMPLGIYVNKEQGDLHIWISKSDGWDQVPVRKYIKIREENFDVDEIVDGFSNVKEKSIYLSRKVNTNEFFVRSLHTHGLSVNGEAFIAFDPIDFDIQLDQYDWLFFSSKNGVRFFFDQIKALPDSLKIAAINKGTGLEIRQCGYELNFVGEGGSLKSIAQTFSKTNGSNVLFIRAKNSKRTIQRNVSNKQIEDVVVYNNYVNVNIEQRKEDVLVFTSSLNVEAYFGQHQLQRNQEVVAIGSTTASTVESFGYSCKTSYDPTMWALIDVIL